jgi:hypothetical protein
VRLFRRETEDRIRRQADQVYAWKESVPSSPGVWRVDVAVHNLSEQPIWNVDVGLVRSGQRFWQAPDKQGAKDMEPSGTTRWEWRMSEQEQQQLDRQVALDFTDASGRRWRRTGSSLERLGVGRRLKRWWAR